MEDDLGDSSVSMIRKTEKGFYREEIQIAEPARRIYKNIWACLHPLQIPNTDV